MSGDVISKALHLMPYGFYALTSRSDDDENAMVCNWVIQTSFEPRQLTVALQKTSHTHGIIEKGRVFTLNIFRKEDEEKIKPFTKSRHKKPDKMSEVIYESAPETGCPILDGAAAYIECRVMQIVDTGGDHDLVVGEVVGANVMKDGEVTDSLTLSHIGWSYAG